MARYLLFASHAYSYAIMRPLQTEIRRRGDEAAWFLEPTCPDRLEADELRLTTLKQVMEWNPRAVFAPGNWVYDFFPGVKVHLFHGFPISKRGPGTEGYFKLRGWFDMFCTQGPAGTGPFRRLEAEKGYFKVYETGWPKFDTFFPITDSPTRHEPLTILYSTTFTKGISSAPVVIDEIRRLAAARPWRWIITFHPKLTDPSLHEAYRRLSEEFDNVEFTPDANGIDTFRRADVMLSDSSSIINEFLITDKPAVTLRNTNPGPWLINIQEPREIEAAIQRAATRPPKLMEHVRAYAMLCDPHRDGRNSARVLDTVDDFIANHQQRLRRKPLNIIRKLKLRWKLRHIK